MRTLTTYGRLLGYLKPYRSLLLVGILAGCLGGGSNIGLLTIIRTFAGSWERPAATAKTEKPSGTASMLEKINPAPRIASRLGIERIDPDKAKVSLQYLLILVSVAVFMVIFRATMIVANKFCLRWIGLQVVRDLRNQLFDHLQRQSLTFYGKSDVGELVSRVNNDTGAIERAVSTTVADIFRAPFEILGVLIYLVLLTVARPSLLTLWLLLGVVIPITFVPILHFSRRIKLHVASSLEQISSLLSRMVEVFTGIRIVKAFNTETLEAERFAAVNNRYIRQLKKALRAELSIEVVLDLMNAILFCLIVVTCFLIELTMADLFSIVMAAVYCYEPAKRLAKVNTELQRSNAAAERIFSKLDMDTTIQEAAVPQRLAAFDDRITVEDVSFSYCPEQPGQEVLRNVSLTIPKGKVVAFVGRAGSGKTTLVNLVARFYDPTAGRIRIDGTDLRDVKLADLRELIGVVTQDTILFNDTIASNIAYGSSSIDRERLLDAARRANAHEFIMKKEGAYEFVVGEKGFQLSGGQKQRIAIARALYKDPEILILDEATSSLDSVTEQLVQEALNELMKDRTVLAIAHRLSTIRSAYRIFVMDHGRIIEEGTHEELLAKDGAYTVMNRIQALD